MRTIDLIILASKDKNNPKSILYSVSKFRQGVKYSFIKKVRNLINLTDEHDTHSSMLKRFSPEEKLKILEGLNMVMEVLNRENWNEETHKLIKTIENYDSNKQDRSNDQCSVQQHGHVSTLYSGKNDTSSKSF